MLLSIKTVVKFNKKESIILNNMAYSAYKLWNIANYEKRNYKTLGFSCFPNWYEQKKRLKSNFFYKNLPSQTAQEVLNTLQQSWNSFFTLKKTKGVINLQPPRFKRAGIGFSYLNNGFVKIGDLIRFSISKQLKTYLSNNFNIDDAYFYLKTKRFSNINNIKQIRFNPIKDNVFEIIAIYEIEDRALLNDNGKYLSIDLGVKNLMTCYDNAGKSYILSGNRYANACFYYNKEIAYYQSISDAQQSAKGTKYPKKSKKVLALYKKRNNIVSDYIHKTTCYIKDYCLNNDINTVVIGNLVGIREDKNLGRKNNQLFHALPYDKIYNKLEYKLKICGINLIKQNEAYSSQCSPSSEKVSKKHASKESRKYRGLYVDGETIYNADCVGAYNILRLYRDTSKKVIECPLMGLSNPAKVSV